MIFWKNTLLSLVSVSLSLSSSLLSLSLLLPVILPPPRVCVCMCIYGNKFILFLIYLLVFFNEGQLYSNI